MTTFYDVDKFEGDLIRLQYLCNKLDEFSMHIPYVPDADQADAFGYFCIEEVVTGLSRMHKDFLCFFDIVRAEHFELLHLKQDANLVQVFDLSSGVSDCVSFNQPVGQNSIAPIVT